MVFRGSVVDYRTVRKNPATGNEEFMCYHFDVNTYHIELRSRLQGQPMPGELIFKRGGAEGIGDNWLDEDHCKITDALKMLEEALVEVGRKYE